MVKAARSGGLLVGAAALGKLWDAMNVSPELLWLATVAGYGFAAAAAVYLYRSNLSRFAKVRPLMSIWIVVTVGAVVGGLIAGYTWRQFTGKDAIKPAMVESFGDVGVALRFASGGNEQGRFFAAKGEWFWLMTNMTLVNQSDESEVISFELTVPFDDKGSEGQFRPVTTPPPNFNFGNVRLFGVENIPARTPVTGALLFKLPRLNIRSMSALLVEKNLPQAEIDALPDTPNILNSRLKLFSELEPRRRPKIYDAVSLMIRDESSVGPQAPPAPPKSTAPVRQPEAKTGNREDVKSVEVGEPEPVLTPLAPKAQRPQTSNPKTAPPPALAQLTLVGSSLSKNGRDYKVTLEIANIGREGVHVDIRFFARARIMATGEIQDLALNDDAVLNHWLFEAQRAMRREEKLTLHDPLYELFKAKKVEVTYGFTAVYPSDKPTSRYVVEGILNDEMTGFNLTVNRREPLK